MKNGSSGLRQLLTETVIPILLLCLLEIGFRSYVSRSTTIPLPSMFPSAVTTGKYLAFQRAVRNHGPFDILLTGLSPMMRVSAAELERILEERTGSRMKAFNFAGPFQGAYFTQKLLNDIVVPQGKPALLIHGIMPLDVVLEPLSGEKYEELLDRSPGFQIHAAGLKARLQRLLLTHFKVVLYREVIRDKLAGKVQPPDPWSLLARGFDDWGHSDFYSSNRSVTRLKPAERAMRRRWAVKYFPWSLKRTPLFTRLTEMAVWCEERGIRFVLVNTPVHPLFKEILPHGLRDYQLYMRYLNKFTQDTGIPLFNPTGGSFGNPSLFADTHHHNQAGEKWLTHQIAGFLLQEDRRRRCFLKASSCSE